MREPFAIPCIFWYIQAPVEIANFVQQYLVFPEKGEHVRRFCRTHLCTH